MLIFWDERLAFLAQSKTGSTAYHLALRPRADIVIMTPPQLKHATLQRFNRFVRPMLEVAGAPEIETIAVIREPIDWLGSWYRYRSRGDLAGAANSTSGMSFDAFAQAYLDRPRPAFAEVGSQAKFLTGPKGDLRVDRLFRYEARDRLDDFLRDRLGIEFDLPRANVSPDRPLDLEARTHRRLERRLHKEYALWESALH